MGQGAPPSSVQLAEQVSFFPLHFSAAAGVTALVQAVLNLPPTQVRTPGAQTPVQHMPSFSTVPAAQLPLLGTQPAVAAG